jgi:hypothetical protein
MYHFPITVALHSALQNGRKEPFCKHITFAKQFLAPSSTGVNRMTLIMLTSGEIGIYTAVSSVSVYCNRCLS